MNNRFVDTSLDFIKLSDREPRAAAQRENGPLHEVADVHAPKIDVAVRYAFAKGRAAYRAEGTPEAAGKAVRAALLDVLPGTLRKAAAAGANVGIGLLKRMLVAEDRSLAKRPLQMRFDVNDPLAIKWAKEHAAELAKGLSETTTEDIRHAVSKAQEAGDLDEQYDAILDAVGNENRAQLIARTESMIAANEGQRLGWEKAVEDGLLPPSMQRTWITTVDACPECEPLEGATATLDGEYPEPGGNGPPLHPNCRCTEGLV